MPSHNPSQTDWPMVIGLVTGIMSIILSVFSMIVQLIITNNQRSDSQNSIQKMNDLSSQASQTLSEVRVMQNTLDRTFNNTLTQLVNLIDKFSSQPSIQFNGNHPPAHHQNDLAAMEIVKSAGELAEVIGESQAGTAIMPGVFMVAREKAKQASCSSNLKQIAIAAMMFSQDNDEKLPNSDKWCDDLIPYLGGDIRVFRCPAVSTEFSYAMNKNLNEVCLSQITDIWRTVLFFDSEINQKNSSDVGESISDLGRHLGRTVIAFADGHVEAVDKDTLNSLKWTV